MRQSVRLSFCPFGAVSLPPVRHICHPHARHRAGGSYFSAPMDSSERRCHFTRWLPLSIEPEKFLYLVSPSPFCSSFACLPKVRAAPSSVRRSLDGAKPQGRTPRAGFQPGTNLSLPKERKSVFLQWINPFGLSLLRFLPLFGAAFFSKHKKRPLYFYICFWNPMGK